jgi:hypothetical protein
MIDFTQIQLSPQPILPNPWKWLAPKNAGDTGGPSSLPDGLHTTCPTFLDTCPSQTLITFAPVVRASGLPYNTYFIEQAVPVPASVKFMSQGTQYMFTTQGSIDATRALETDLQYTRNGTVLDAGMQWLIPSRQILVFDYKLSTWIAKAVVPFAPAVGVRYTFLTEINIDTTPAIPTLTYEAIWVNGTRYPIGYQTQGVPNVYPGVTALNIGLQIDSDNTGRTISVVGETACVTG